MEDNITRLKAKYAATPNLLPKRVGSLTITMSEPVKTFFVLGEQYTSDNSVWYRRVGGVHFIKGKEIVCSQKEEVPAPCFICEEIAKMKARGASRDEIFRVSALVPKFAMNVLIPGEEIPLVYLAPSTVADVIEKDFRRALGNNINIFDPNASTAYTVTRTGNTGDIPQYLTEAALKPEPIFTGDGAEIKIPRILRQGDNLDDRYKVPTREEAIKAWARR